MNNKEYLDVLITCGKVNTNLVESNDILFRDKIEIKKVFDICFKDVRHSESDIKACLNLGRAVSIVDNSEYFYDKILDILESYIRYTDSLLVDMYLSRMSSSHLGLGYKSLDIWLNTLKVITILEGFEINLDKKYKVMYSKRSTNDNKYISLVNEKTKDVIQDVDMIFIYENDFKIIRYNKIKTLEEKLNIIKAFIEDNNRDIKLIITGYSNTITDMIGKTYGHKQ